MVRTVFELSRPTIQQTGGSLGSPFNWSYQDLSYVSFWNVIFAIKKNSSAIYRGYYPVARRYEFYFRVAKQYFKNERIPRPRIPDSTSKNFQDSGFQMQKFPRFRNPDSFTWGDVSIENSTLSNVSTLNLAYKVQNFSDFFGKIPVRILLDVLLCVQVF